MKNNVITPLRNYLLKSESNEELTTKIEIGYKLVSPLFWMFGPRKHKRNGVNERLEFFLKHIKPHQKIVDVGCFDGFFTESLANRGYDVTGVDRLDSIVNKTRKISTSGHYVKGFAEEMPFPDNSFDVGIYSHILHHVFDPNKTISEARRILKPNGKIIVLVPYELGSIQLRVFCQQDLANLIRSYFREVKSYSGIGQSHGCIGIKPQDNNA